jgi:hypothetical protein
VKNQELVFHLGQELVLQLVLEQALSLEPELV